MYAYYPGRKCCHQGFSILTILVQALSLGHVPTTIPLLVCSHGSQDTCFNPIYHPQEKWLEVQSFHSAGDLINHTRVNDPNKPVSIYFGVCTAIAKNPSTWVRMGFNCGNLAWERTYRLDDRYMCPETTSWASSCASYEELYCPY
jgi:hypothetical protein